MTGAARGIGRADRIKSSRAKARDVAVNYYNSHDEAEALCASCARSAGARTRSRAASACQTASTRCSRRSREHFDRIDIVVSNAASGVLKPVMEMGLKHWRWCMETNALAVDLLAQRAVPMMRERRAYHRDVESRRAARDARLRIHRRVEGGARGTGARAGAGARPAWHSRQHGKRRRRRHRRARVFSESRQSCW